MCHNLITQLSPNPKEYVEHTPQLAMAIAHVMSKINNKKIPEGASFGQQYIIQKGLKKFWDRGSKTAAKEMENCSSEIVLLLLM